jgi:MFS family permease
MFAYGSLAVILVLYLAATGLDGAAIGVVLSLTLVGDTLISLWLTTQADRFGRRRTLIVGGLLMAGAGVVFASTSSFVVLIVAATLGVISPTGSEVGPFLAIEQASLAHVIDDRRRTGIFAWYNLVGSLATATGALVTGVTVGLLRSSGFSELAANRVVLLGYAAIGLLIIPIVLAISPSIEVKWTPASIARRFGLHRSRGIVARLSLLFAFDAFAGGLILQSLVAFWFYTRFGIPEPVIGAIFFATNILAAFSALVAARIARRIGLINTMVVTHIPANVLLMLVPLMPALPLAVLVLLLRATMSQMDVPVRQSYTMAVVDPDERSAAAGVTGIARTAGTSISPLIAGPLIAIPGLAAVPFLLAGGLKIVYDLLLWRAFRSTPAPEDPKGVATDPENAQT